MTNALPSELVLSIEKAAAGGRMLARHGGQVVLVSGAIPGERVRARVERVGKGVVYAATVEVIEASPDRRSDASEHPCGGTVYAHIEPARQAALKGDVLTDALARIGRLEVATPIAVRTSPEQGYRLRARLHVRQGSVGFFREGTHDLCDPAATGQLQPAACLVAERIALALRAARLDEVTAVELVENVPATERVVHVELARPVEDRRLVAIARIDGTSGLTFGPADVSSRSGSRLLAGVPHVVEALAVDAGDGSTRTVVLRHHVRSFFQANRYLVAPLASRVAELAGEGPVVDLYAGVGLFALSIASRGRGPVVAVEGDPFSAVDLRANAAAYEGAVETSRMPVERFVAEADLPDGTTVIVDPPRTGMSRAAMDGVVRFGARRVVYVSCDVATFARDLRTLVQAGYRLERVEAFDLFPNTAHVEGLAVLTRG